METDFTLNAVPITTSAVVVIYSGVAAASDVVAGADADILAVAVVAGASAALLADADEVTAAVLAASVISTAAAVQAAAFVEIALLLDGDECSLYTGLPSPPSLFPPSLVGRAFFLALSVRASSCCCS